MRTTILILLSICCCFAHASEYKWHFKKRVNPMDGDTTLLAISPPSQPLEPLSYPNQNILAGINVSCVNGEIMFMVVFMDGTFRIVGDFNNLGTKADIRFKWDNLIESREVLELKSVPENLLIIDDDGLINLASNANQLLIEVPFLIEGMVYFDISLKGSKGAIEKVVNNCKGGA